MTIPDAIILLRDFTAWALLVFLVVGGMRRLWVWGWLYVEVLEQNKRLQTKLDEQSKVVTDAVATLGTALAVVRDGQRVYEVVDTLKNVADTQRLYDAVDALNEVKDRLEAVSQKRTASKGPRG